MSEMLLGRHKKKSFLHRIVTADKKCIHYDNPKRKKSYVKSTAKPNIHGAKVMLCIWWDQKGVLCYEVLKPGEAINGERYRTQLISLKRAIGEKRPEYATRDETIMTTLGPMLLFRLRTIWKKVDKKFYFTRLIAQTLPLLTTTCSGRCRTALTGILFTSEQGIKNWLDSFLAAKPAQFFWHGIHKLQGRWEKVIAVDVQYSE